MRPTPRETVDGIARILRDTVGPAVTDEHARTQLNQVLAVLGQLPWDDPAAVVRAQWSRTHALLGWCRDWLGKHPECAGGFSELAPLSADAPLTFAEADAALTTARAALERFLVELRAWRDAVGPDTSQDLFDRIGAAFAEPT